VLYFLLRNYEFFGDLVIDQNRLIKLKFKKTNIKYKMYKQIDAYLGENNVNSALTECIQHKLYHLGSMIGRLSKPNKNLEIYYDIIGQLYKKTVFLKSVIKHQEEPPTAPPTSPPTAPPTTPPTTPPTAPPTAPPTEPPTEPPTVQPTAPPTAPPTEPPTVQPTEPDSTRVKLLCNWDTSENLCNLWNKMSQGNYRWNKIRLVWDDDNPDYYVIINCPLINVSIVPEKTIVFRMEPNMEKHKYLWGEWCDPDSSKFLKVFRHETDINNSEWHISKTYNELKTQEIVKDPIYDNIISTVLSDKYHDTGHIKRIDFIKFLEKKELLIDVYGNNKWDYKSFKGPLPPHQKDNAMLPYKYSFNVENHSIKNYCTEKILDGILSECLMFYSGCFNLREILPEESFVYLELVDFEKDYNTVKKAIEENWWEKRLPAIREAKKIILDELNFFPRLERFIKDHEKIL
jgi:hypothetical protein